MSYQDMSGLELFGDPFYRPQAYSQPVSRNSYSQATQQKTPVQQPVQTNSTATQVQQPQPPTNSVTQAKTPVLQQKANAPAPEPKSVTSVPTEKTTPADTKPAPTKQELVMDMSSDTSSKLAIDDTAKRKAHEEAEAKRKAAWEEKQLAKKQAEEAAIQKLQSMSDDDIIAASIKRVSTDVERLTRRNMKECVSEYIQELARKDVVFARKTMHPRKNMINCFKYINHRAKEFVEQEMKDNDIKPENGIYGTDVPDGLCYQWAEDYFNSTDLPEDGEEEKFIPRPYVGTTSKTSSKPKKAASKAKKTEKQVTKETKKKQESSSGYEQMSFV